MAVAVIYGGLCLADDQYDLLGAQWNERGTSRGLAAVALAFIFLLVVGFFTDTIEGYSRGTASDSIDNWVIWCSSSLERL